MKLSDAIRLGAMLKPQGFGGGSANPKGEALCALGAAYAATGSKYRWSALIEACPLLVALEFVACPVCGSNGDGSPVAHLNDDHKWTREQIADWVETIEQQQAQTPEPQPVSVEV